MSFRANICYLTFHVRGCDPPASRIRLSLGRSRWLFGASSTRSKLHSELMPQGQVLEPQFCRGFETTRTKRPALQAAVGRPNAKRTQYLIKFNDCRRIRIFGGAVCARSLGLHLFWRTAPSAFVPNCRPNLL